MSAGSARRSTSDASRLLIPLADIRAARERIADVAIRTPLVRLQAPEAPAEIWLKLECLQPIGSFKIRGAANAIRSTARETIAAGVLTTSAGNMAQGVAWIAREEQVPATIIVPDHAPQTKLDAIERLGGRVIKVPFERWWQAMEEGAYPGVDGHFVHPVMDDDVMAGNGTIGLEPHSQLTDCVEQVRLDRAVQQRVRRSVDEQRRAKRHRGRRLGLARRVRRDPDIERLALVHGSVSAPIVPRAACRVIAVGVEDVDVVEPIRAKALVEAREQVPARAAGRRTGRATCRSRLRGDDQLVAVRPAGPGAGG